MDIPAHGTLALIGSGEYLPPIMAVDKQLLERINSTPRVVVLPTAAAPDGDGVPERWAEMGVTHFTKLGAVVEPVMLLNRADADKSKIVEQIATANFIYLSGGKPRYLLEALQGTAAWQAMRDVLAKGGVLAGCSAGAMVLGAKLFDFPQIWRTIPALGLVHRVAIIPHFDEIPAMMASTLSKNRGRRKNKLIVVGIDGSTALTRLNGRWTVLGSGGVTVFQGSHKVRYIEGAEVPLPDNS
jgi:cyanophycinase